ncbi:transporter substrate-binding domain-containing protein [Ensifer sp. ENS05]|uniref:transporter substrate-binding domain-containing protein n=1 Tax=Ensifer sp. ENS05 TaxID=2769277 RepID=UPI001783FBC0|nr:transporter substrate-binding domain-containing protein [Ensifer sp. ENS05]MBD9596909.1 transporter substrate-binding domain-containing protein [Ensifer sp. ENS05]
MKKLISSVTIALLLAGAASAADLKIGTSADYPPWESVDASGEIVGFDRDFGNELCKRIGESCVWSNQAYDGLLPGLQVGKFDLVISGVSINEERAKQVDFSAAYADAPNSVVAAADSDAAKAVSVGELLEALKGKTVGVQTGTTHEQVAAAHFEGAQVRLYDRPDQVVDDLLAGRIEAGLMERSALEPLMKDRGAGKLSYAGPSLTSSDFPEFGQGQGVAIRKGKDELLSKIDEAVKAMLSDGTLSALSEKWFSYDLAAKKK